MLRSGWNLRVMQRGRAELRAVNTNVRPAQCAAPDSNYLLCSLKGQLLVRSRDNRRRVGRLSSLQLANSTSSCVGARTSDQRRRREGAADLLSARPESAVVRGAITRMVDRTIFGTVTYEWHRAGSRSLPARAHRIERQNGAQDASSQRMIGR